MLRSLFSYVAAGLGLAFSTVSAAEPEAPCEWALVGTPDRRFLWILARQPCLPPEVLADLKAQARCLGFDVGSLVGAR